MAKKPESFHERMKKKPLSFWGILCIFCGIFSTLGMNLAIDAAHLRRAEERAMQIGGTVGGGLVVIVGIVLLVVHFVRRTRR